MKPAKFTSLAIFSVAVAIYLFFASSNLQSPGLYYDEVLFANAALGNPDGLFVAWSLPLGGHKFPLMLMGYLGALKAYLYAPLFMLFGTSVTVVRFPMILVGAVTLYLSWRLAIRMFGSKIGWTFLALTAADPTFIINHRLDWGPVALGLLFKAGSLYLIWRWLEEAKDSFLLGSFFLMGLGLYDKALFLWYLLALGGALLLVYRQRIQKLSSGRLWFKALGLFLLGALPLVAYNFRGPMRTFRQAGLLAPTPLSEWSSRLRLAQSTLNGSSAFYNIHQIELKRYWVQTPESAGIMPGALGEWFRSLRLEGSLCSCYFLASVFLLLLLLVSRRMERPKPVLFLLLLLSFMYSASWLTLNRATGQHHVVPLYPLPHLVIAVALWSLGRIYPAILTEGRKLWHSIFPLSLAGVLWLSQMGVAAAYLDSFRRQGGRGLWSEAVNELAQVARENPRQALYLMDWGISNQLLVLGGGKIRKAEYYHLLQEAPTREEQQRIWRFCWQRPGTWLVFHDPSCQTFPALRLFEEALAAEGRSRRLIREINDWQRRPVFWIYEVESPEIDRYQALGGSWIWQEAEEWSEKSCGGMDFPPTASMGRALGMHWGGHAGDWVTYKLELKQPMQKTKFQLRYLQEGEAGRRLRVTWDANFAADLVLNHSPGNGSHLEDWLSASLDLGRLEAGTHDLRIQSVSKGKGISLDCWVISAGEPPAFW